MSKQDITTRPNYRVYDFTGGGVTEDIRADSIEDAISQGRHWMEGGGWDGDGGEDAGEGRVYRLGVPLDCQVGEIVYVALNEQGVYERRLNGHDDESYTVRAEDGQLVDADDNELGLAVGDEDEEATACADKEDCSGEYSDSLPDCKMAVHAGDDADADAEGHVWRAPFLLVGGCRENPGVWGGSGTGTSFAEVCRLCGCRKHTCSSGSQRNPDEPREVITIQDRDEAGEAWLKETHEEDGWLPGWLAEFLGVSPSARMTYAQAEAWVRAHDDHDDLDDEDLEHAFAATYERRPDDEDRQTGLWSLLCAHFVHANP